MMLSERLERMNRECSSVVVVVAINNAYIAGMYKLCSELLSAYGY